MQAAVEGREERVMMRWHNKSWCERTTKSRQVVARAFAPGEPDEQDVGARAGELGVDEIGRAVVVDAQPADVDEDAEGAAHAVAPRARRQRRRRGHLARKRPAPEGGAAMPAR